MAHNQAIMSAKKLETPDTGTGSEVASDSLDDLFLTPQQLCARLHLGRGRLRAWQKKGLLPHIRPDGSRKILFSWASVKAALARMERQAGS
jgi:excisionase family DNA binding protein